VIILQAVLCCKYLYLIHYKYIARGLFCKENITLYHSTYSTTQSDYKLYDRLHTITCKKVIATQQLSSHHYARVHDKQLSELVFTMVRVYFYVALTFLGLNLRNRSHNSYSLCTLISTRTLKNGNLTTYVSSHKRKR
jgi:hypothetical protein